MALLRNSISGKRSDRNQYLVNMSFIPFVVYLGLFPIILFLSYESFTLPLIIFILAAGVELLTEPFYIYCQSRLLYSIRVQMESSSFIVTSFMTLLGCHLFKENDSNQVSHEKGIIIYGIAYLLGSIYLFLGYVFKVKAHLESDAKIGIMQYFTPKKVLSRKILTGQYLDTYLMGIVSSFVLQTIVKHFLTVADKIALVSFGAADSQKGQYKLVSDLGSLVARMIFFPIEDTSRAYFAQTLTHSTALLKKENLENSFNYLKALVKFQVLFGLPFVFFAPNYTSILLRVLHSNNDIETSRLLSFYCCYVPFMGVNGITEAFLQGVGSAGSLNSQMVYMVAFWCIYVATSYLFISILQLASLGIILSNILNMVLRIGFSASFIFGYYRTNGYTNWKIKDFLPGSIMLYTSLIASFFITRWSFHSLDSVIIHIVFGIICCLINFWIFYQSEKRAFLHEVVNLLKKR